MRHLPAIAGRELQSFFTTPVAYVLIAAYLIALLPRLNAGPAALISVALLIVLVVAELALMTSQAIWVKLMTAASVRPPGSRAA